MKQTSFLTMSIAWLLIVTGASLTKAQSMPVGAEFQVNTTTTGAQRKPAVDRDDSGRFIAVWLIPEVTGQRFAADGTLLGSEFQVNSYTTNTQSGAAVAAAPNGDFVVVWQSYGEAPDQYRVIRGRRYTSAGTPVSAGFQVNSTTTVSEFAPDVSTDGDGDFVAVWAASRVGNYDIWGRRFASDGSALGSDFQVNSYTTGTQGYSESFRASIASEANGDFVVVWGSFGSPGTDSDGRSVLGRRFASSGSPIGSDFQINTYTTGDQDEVAIASDPDGNFVVIWESDGSSGTDSDSQSIQGQRFASDGSTIGSEFQINSYTTGGQLLPDVLVDAGGNFAVVWTGPELEGQLFAADGSPVGAQFQINTYTTGGQLDAAVAADPSGNFVVTWQSSGSPEDDDDSFSILGQRFEGPVPVELQSFTIVDDSESPGDE